MKPFYPTHCRGSIAIITAASLIVLIGMVGLAIDLGRGYGVKAKLNAAVDAAAIAASRALVVGATDDIRRANAQAAALKFFDGNFPQDYLGATPTSVPHTITTAVHDAAGFWTVTVSASANMPTTFLRVIGKNNVQMAATSQSIRRDLDMILVIDTSGSLDPPFSPTGTFTKVKASAVSFINQFIESTDRIGLITFADGASDPSAPPSPADVVPINKTITRGFSKTDVTDAINGLTNGGFTASAEAMRKALNEINAVPQTIRSSLRVIVFFSDGAPNNVPATFPSVPVTGDLFSETNGTGGAPQQISDNNRRNPPSNNYTIAALPKRSGTSLTDPIRITDTGVAGAGTATIPLYDATLAGQRPLTLMAAPTNGSYYINTRCNVNKAAKNMAEWIANIARNNPAQPIAIFTLGLGSYLNQVEMTNCGYGSSEYGANFLKRLANTTDSDTFHPPLPDPNPQPTGLYCYAADTSQLDDCFNAIKNAMLRLTR